MYLFYFPMRYEIKLANHIGKQFMQPAMYI